MTHTPDPRIVCLGESIVDLIGEPDADGRVAYRAHPGGSPLNAAVAAARLGAPTAMLTRFSDDAFGAQLREHLSAAGVDLRLAEAGPQPTSMAVVTIDAEGRATYGFYRAETADVSYDPRPRPALPSSVSVGNVTVSLLREPSRTAFHDIVRESGRAGRGAVTWVLDPNARPALWSGPAAFGREFAAWVPLVDVVKVSDEDLAYLGGEESATAAGWLADGVAAVVVTAGAGGARLYRPGHAPLSVPGRRVDVVDTVGAGDTFTAGLTTGLVDGPHPRDLDEAAWNALLRRAVAASSITCTRVGADPPTAAELDAVLMG
ncbi:MAG TPA: carbohydrate kinase [Thermoleophilia bacterium]|nr:carbohydrate kinase [Thermoleophilia bacterium]